MLQLPLASAWHNFWNWFDHLDTPNKIAYWTFLASVGAAIGTAFVGYFAALIGAKRGAEAAFDLGWAKQQQELEDNQFSVLNATEYIVTQYRNDFKNYYEGNFADFLKEDGTMIIPIMYLPEHIERIPVDKLYFLADIKPDFLRGIQIAGQRYASAIEQFRTIRRLADRHRESDNSPQLLPVLKTNLLSTRENLKNSLRLFDEVLLDLKTFQNLQYPNHVAAREQLANKFVVALASD